MQPGIASLNPVLHHHTIADHEDRRFRESILDEFPPRIRKAVAAQYHIIDHREGRRAANLFLLDCKEKMSALAIRLASSDEDLCDFARAKAKRAGRMVSGCNMEDAFRSLCHFVREYRLEPPFVRFNVTVTGAVKRMCDERWWRRAIRRIHGQAVEAFAIELGLVHRHADLYSSDETVARYRGQKRRNKEMLAAMVAVNEEGEMFTLEQLAALSVSNPTNRRNELMVRIAGFEALAHKFGDGAWFLTITCPSRMHSHYAESGDRNPRYDGTTPKERCAYLNQVWRCIRAALNRRGIRIYGFRVLEPMHDGTPHTHFLVFVNPKHTGTLLAIFKKYALQEDGDEPGAQEHRFKAVKIDPNKGSATGYIAKYIAKNIDGAFLDCDVYGNDPIAAAERVRAWSANWNARQFQQFGGPPVSVWRELRRMGQQDNPELEAIRAAANAGRWDIFTELMGGPTATREEIKVKLAHLYNPQPGQYDEPKGMQVVGVEYKGQTFLRTKHQWTIIYNPVRTRFELGQAPDSELAHNCTQHDCEQSGTQTRTGQNPNAHRAGSVPGEFEKGPALSRDFLILEARSDSSYLEYCQ